MPGQTISVNKYTVQVERYLSQGGFAQVYLVRTQVPVYNTTHHVLKHVVVANESMLTEVKKEVDVMRLLRGHPNIVYLIDAAWAKMPNGAFEVYILMEYCPGGGIIDMMNRRLRERLTEAEILQIFVEVCEGVAHMHNSRPSLLHRDLKVENILQSSTTSFKLCDFGSTSTVSKSPTNSQEIRALEADLNRHTTLQYRAPEMIDLHSRRPIDEKSDVWALAVLLYKLCYYTTPFEEHGPLAILNVQYRFPSYPVYSQQMMHLISSMLREHGAQRPTVFEVLAHAHSLRGTKSAYNYPLPTPTPLSPRHTEFRSNPLDGVITYRQSTQAQTSSVQPVAKQQTKAAELTTPLERRGRPRPNIQEIASPSPPVPLKTPAYQPAIEKTKLIDDSDFGADGDAVWSSAIAKNTSMAQASTASEQAWHIQSIPGPEKAAKSSPLPPNVGFNDDFAQKLWASTGSVAPSPRPQTYSPRIGPLPHATLALNDNIQKTRPDLQIRTAKERDAFEGLGLMTPVSKPAPTLGEARKLRTGLAIMSTNVNRQPIKPSPSPRLRPKAHTPRVSPIPPHRSLEPETPWPPSRPPLDRSSSSAETRFPSLEELDATFSSSSSSVGTPSKQKSKPVHQGPEPPSLPPRPTKVGSVGTGSGFGTSTSLLKSVALGTSGTRSEQVTEAVIRDAKGDDLRKSRDEDLLSLGKREPERRDGRESSGSSGPGVFNLSRPLFTKGNKSTLTTITSVGNTSRTQPSPPIFPINHAARSKDLLTGDDESELPPRQLFDPKMNHDIFKIRESPSKRASVIERSDVLEATIPQQGHAPTPPVKGSPIIASKASLAATSTDSPTAARLMKAFPAIDTSLAVAHHSSGLTDNWSPVAATAPYNPAKERKAVVLDSSSEDEGPEEPTASSSAPPKVPTDSQSRHKGRQSSVHDLVDLWGGGLANTKEKQHESPVTSVPAPFKQNTGATKHKSTFMPPPRASSPPRKSSPLASSHLNQSPLALKNELPSQMSAGAPPSPSPKTGRARPQSMFIFPSRTTEAPAQPSASLVPPEEPKLRSSRRTSISDMVQRYEAIQASARVSGNAVPPSPVNPPSTRDQLQDSTGHRPIKPSLDKIAVALPGLGTPLTSVGDPVKRKTSLTVASTRAALSSQRASPISPAVSNNMEAENVPPRTRNTSIMRSEPIKLPTTPSRKPVLNTEELTNQPRLESSVSTSSVNTDRSPSPEQPYQGVGKLIDQWQRKSAEAEASRNAILSKRANLASPKRAGLVPSTGKGS
ncbi:hypothetical protein P691DRAFT_699476 [Macrolepiota fuliginosa MF-IS2]|uniref:non-specific serine/threonine protein kinase n=1 Tax=Macrolepiota fuliginosa MF-IS2 TaxID=1400762 RepID=A0A9P5XKW0_9AGAR|nr:hypothetical protein P691DRAFT_699476 [Macrolepiota fuliginosa MF-IS2]